jgi:hypothetical protein
MEKTEFEQMRDKALEQLMKGQVLTGKDGLGVTGCTHIEIPCF